MPRTRRSVAVSKKSTELALAAPQVVAHRVTRMALAGINPSTRDQKEFTGMVEEKHTAFVQSWLAMSMEAARVQQRLAWSMWVGLMTPWTLSPVHSLSRLKRQAENGAWAIVEKGLDPIHSKAVSNSKRLAKTPLV